MRTLSIVLASAALVLATAAQAQGPRFGGGAQVGTRAQAGSMAAGTAAGTATQTRTRTQAADGTAAGTMGDPAEAVLLRQRLHTPGTGLATTTPAVTQ